MPHEHNTPLGRVPELAPSLQRRGYNPATAHAEARFLQRLPQAARATIEREAGQQPQLPAQDAPSDVRVRDSGRRAARRARAQARAREARAQTRARAREAQAQAQAREAQAVEARAAAFEARELAKLDADELAEIEADELAEDCPYGLPVPKAVWGMRSILLRSRDRAKTAQGWLRWARTRFSEVEVGQLAQAALCPDEQGGFCYGWADENAIRVLVCGLAMLRLRGEIPHRDGPKACMRGISRGTLQALMRDSQGCSRGTTWISGYLRDDLPEGERPLQHLGLLKRLERVGFSRSVQLPAQAATVEEFERKPDRNGVMRCINRYYLHGREWAARAGAAVVDALTELARVASECRIRRAPRTVYERAHAEKRDAAQRARAPD